MGGSDKVRGEDGDRGRGRFESRDDYEKGVEEELVVQIIIGSRDYSIGIILVKPYRSQRHYIIMDESPSGSAGDPFFMFANTVQPGIVSLFSSTSSEPLSLFSQQKDESLAEDSFIHFLIDASSLPPPLLPAVLCSMPPVDSDHDESNIGYGLHQTVLHIQSPTLRKTFIQCPPSPVDRDLCLKHKWLHIQVRCMGREWSFDIGIVDKSGKRGVIRCSTFQVHILFFSRSTF
jgi:hypothetical protein